MMMMNFSTNPMEFFYEYEVGEKEERERRERERERERPSICEFVLEGYNLSV